MYCLVVRWGCSCDSSSGAQVQRNYRSGSADDAGFLMSNADSVVIVPGYGMAQGRAQNAVKELANLLKEQMYVLFTGCWSYARSYERIACRS